MRREQFAVKIKQEHELDIFELYDLFVHQVHSFWSLKGMKIYQVRQYNNSEDPSTGFGTYE